MNRDSILSMFAGHAFFKGMSDRHLMMLATGAQPFTAAAGDYLGRLGQEAVAFYLIQSGKVSLSVTTHDRGEVVVQTVGPGDVVGWSWLLPPHRWQFDARALEAVRGVRFNAEWLREKCEQDYSLGYHVLRQLVGVLAGRLAGLRRQLPLVPAQTGNT